MKSSDFLVKLLREFVNLTLGVFVVVSVLPKVNLSKSLIGE